MRGDFGVKDLVLDGGHFVRPVGPTQVRQAACKLRGSQVIYVGRNCDAVKLCFGILKTGGGGLK